MNSYPHDTDPTRGERNMADQSPGSSNPDQPEVDSAPDRLYPENSTRLPEGEEVLARYNGCGFAPGLSGFLLGRVAKNLVVTDRRLVLDYGLGDSTTLHYGPGAEVSLYRALPKIPVLSLLKRAALVLIALVLLSGGPIYTALGVLLLAAVAHCYVTDWVFSTLELVTPAANYPGFYRTTRAQLFTGFRRTRIRAFLEELNTAMADSDPSDADAVVPDLRDHGTAVSHSLVLLDETSRIPIRPMSEGRTCGQ